MRSRVCPPPVERRRHAACWTEAADRSSIEVLGCAGPCLSRTSGLSENHYRGPASGTLSAPGRARDVSACTSYVWLVSYSVDNGLVRTLVLTTNVSPAAGAGRFLRPGLIRASDPLAAEPQLLDQRAVAVDVLAGQVLQQAPAAADK